MAKTQFFRCALKDNGLGYDKSMGIDGQDQSINYIISKGFKLASGCVKIKSREIMIYAIITPTSDFHSYLQRLSKSRFFLPGQTSDVWLDVKENVIFTFNRSNQLAIVSALNRIKV